MASPITSFSAYQIPGSSTPIDPSYSQPAIDGAAIDKFSTLFSPATPRASPTLEPTSSDMKITAPRPRSHHPEASGSDSEFGSFVSVSAMEDPLAALDFELTPPIETENTNIEGNRSTSSSLSFFGKFAQDAKVAAERNKRGVLDELLMHEDDPLYWLKGQDQLSSMDPPMSQSAIPLSRENRVDERGREAVPANKLQQVDPSSLLDLDHDFFTSKAPLDPLAPTPAQHHLRPTTPHSPTRSPTLPAPPTLAPPLADTSSASSSSSPPNEFSDPLSASNLSELERPSRAPRSNSYSTLTSLSSKWMTSLLPASKTLVPSTMASAHSSTPSLESLFAFEAASSSKSKPRAHSSDQHTRRPSGSSQTMHHHAATLPPQPVQISHGTPFGRTLKASPFASHIYTPPSGAPGFKGDTYDWDKGFSAELERELGTGEDEREREMMRAGHGARGHVKGATHIGVGEYMEKKSGSVQLSGRRAATVPVLGCELADMIRPHLPALARLPRTWTLLYSLDQHGISLNTLYSRCEAYTQSKPGTGSPAGSLVIVKDAGEGLFGVWMGEDGVRLSRGKGYYGSGESFLWKYVAGKFQVFKWTGKNDYVALCEPGFLSFGGGDGHYGLYLDDTLFEGSSASCPTFGNEPLCSAGPKAAGMATFECVGLEVWGVGP